MNENYIIVDLGDESVTINDSVFDLKTVLLFERNIMVPKSFTKRIYKSGVKHYIASRDGVKSLNSVVPEFDNLFDKIEEIKIINQKIKSKTIKIPSVMVP